MNCSDCNKSLVFKTVKQGKNKGREYSRCCDRWYWNDSLTYDTDKFKNGACYRCGYWGCYIDDPCEKVFDWFGNKIPESEEF